MTRPGKMMWSRLNSLAFDRLFVDESHFYKNLFLYTKNEEYCGDRTDRRTEKF